MRLCVNVLSRAGAVVSAVALLTLGVGTACSSNGDEAVKDAEERPTGAGHKPGTTGASDLTLKDFEVMNARYARPTLTADTSHLSDGDKAALEKLIEASRLLDPIFDRQAWQQNPALLEALAKDTSPLGQARLRYVQTHRGPWDRQEHFMPFAVDFKRPDGAGFYPEDVTKEELDKWLADHPEDKAAFEGLFTVIRRDGDKLVAKPYREVYGEWLTPAAEKLREAAALTDNASLKTFLLSRADAFLSDDYYQSDKDWMDLDSPVEITIGPYEVYEDNLNAWKASYESFVTVADPKASAQLAKFKSLLPEMEQNLPVDDSVKTTRGSESPIRVVDLVFTAGDARKSVQTIAFNLPNDERVRAEKGAKKVMLRNAIETKFNTILQPIGERTLAKDQQQYLDASAFFHEVLFHELSHSLGPAYVENKGETEVRVAIGADYSTIEEAKADVMGAYNILYMINKGEFEPAFREKLLVSYFAGLFRSVRFGVAEAHGRGAALQFNYHLEKGGAVYDEGSQTFSVDMDKLEASITELVRDLCMLQHHGDKAGVAKMLETYGIMTPPMEAELTKFGGIPVDIRPIFPLAGEAG